MKRRFLVSYGIVLEAESANEADEKAKMMLKVEDIAKVATVHSTKDVTGDEWY